MILKKASLSEQTENARKEEILKGRFAPAEKISIEALAEEWGVSNTPIRDAMRRLEKAVMLKVIPRRGVYVETIDRQDFQHVFDLRIALECLAVKSATVLIPDEEVQGLLGTYEEAERRLRDPARTRCTLESIPGF